MDRWTLVGIGSLALFARIMAAAAIAPSTESLIASAHHEHASIAKNLAEGRGFRFNFFGDIDHPDLTSQQAPFVPGLLASAYCVFGVETSAALWSVIIIQILGGAIGCAALADSVRTWTQDQRVAIAAGAVAALHPPFVVASLHIQALPWNLLWIGLLFAGSGRMRLRERGGASIFVVGASGGLYTDPILAVVMGTLLIIVALPGGERRRCLKVGVLIALSISPWIARNYQVHGRFEFIKNSFPYVFWQGNTLLSVGTDKLLVEDLDRQRLRSASVAMIAGEIDGARKRSRSINDVALTERDLLNLAALPDETARMDWFGNRIRAELVAHPWHYPRMCLVRLRQWVWFDETNPKSVALPYRVSYLIFAAGAAAGIAMSWRRVWPYLAAGIALTLVHVLVITSARFRISFELTMVPAFCEGASSMLSLLGRMFAIRPRAAKAHVLAQ